MNQLKWYSGFAAALLVAACAGAPEATETAAAQATAIHGGSLAASNASGADAARSTDADGQPLVVDAREAATAAPPIICRDVLQQVSNTVVRQCMTAAQWRSYERYKEREGQAILRQLQGNPYR